MLNNSGEEHLEKILPPTAISVMFHWVKDSIDYISDYGIGTSLERPRTLAPSVSRWTVKISYILRWNNTPEKCSNASTSKTYNSSKTSVLGFQEYGTESVLGWRETFSGGKNLLLYGVRSRSGGRSEDYRGTFSSRVLETQFRQEEKQ